MYPNSRSRLSSAAAATAAVCALIAQAAPHSADASVMDSGPAGFTTSHSVTIAAPRAEVYRAAVRSIGSWWNDDHTVSGHSANLYLEARTQGCFCERLGEQGGVVHLTVTFVNPAVMLRLSGGLGPLGLMGVNGNMTWEFADEGDGTTVTWSYAVGGYLEGGLDRIAGAVDSVLVDQMTRLKEYVEQEASQPGQP